MSFATAQALQAAVYAALKTDASVTALAHDAIFDALPKGNLPALYIVLGAENTRDHSTQTSAGALHDIEVEIYSDAPGFQTAKQLAAAVCDALIDADLTLDRGKLIRLHFKSARARKGTGSGQRVVRLMFRACVMEHDLIS